MKETKITLTTPYIEMDKLLKLTNIASSGGEAHMLILDGYVKLNEVTIHEKRKKVYPDSIVTVDNKYKIIVLA